MPDFAKLSPAPWEAELRGQTSEETTHYAVLTPKGRVVCDTLNSEVAEIETDYDESASVHRNLQGREDMQFVALARNAFDVMTRRNLHAEWSSDGRMFAWHVYGPDGCKLYPLGRLAGFMSDDPFSALVEADAWLTANSRD